MDTHIPRIVRHLLFTKRQLHRAFPPSSIATITQAIHASEQEHAGEICFAVEGCLDGLPLFKGQSDALKEQVKIQSPCGPWACGHRSVICMALAP
jgi:hypothetical protein